MTKLYDCTKCKESFPLTEEYFYKHLITSCENNPNKTAAGQCKVCAKSYGDNYRENLKKKRLTRKNAPPKLRSNGTLYIVGTTPENPVKIGMTTGSSLKARLAALQTSHWLDLKILYKSPLCKNISKLEKELHDKYRKYLIRGEWYCLTPEKILEAQKLAEKFRGTQEPLGK
jgi:hypothetical protein